MPRPRRSFTPDEMDQAIELYEGQGMPLIATAKAMHACHLVLRRELEAAGIAIRDPGGSWRHRPRSTLPDLEPIERCPEQERVRRETLQFRARWDAERRRLKAEQRRRDNHRMWG